MKLKPPWLVPNCGFELELQSWVGAAGVGGQLSESGNSQARPASPVSGCTQGGFQVKQASSSRWCPLVVEDPV